MNRPVPCKIKGIREFPRHSVTARIAPILQGVACSNHVSPTRQKSAGRSQDLLGLFGFYLIYLLAHLFFWARFRLSPGGTIVIILFDWSTDRLRLGTNALAAPQQVGRSLLNAEDAEAEWIGLN